METHEKYGIYVNVLALLHHRHFSLSCFYTCPLCAYSLETKKAILSQHEFLCQYKFLRCFINLS